MCSRLEGKDCSDESSARTYGDGPRFKNSQRKTPFAIELDLLLFLFVFLGVYNSASAELAIWGFYLSFQMAGYHGLEFFLERRKDPSTSHYPLFFFSILTFLQLLCGLYFFHDLFLVDPLRLISLLVGACIVLVLTSLAKGDNDNYVLPSVLLGLAIFVIAIVMRIE